MKIDIIKYFVEIYQIYIILNKIVDKIFSQNF